ncbi:hypothetical protein ACFQFC_01120 [Amorphoplanes digitatis]|uniref:hypothetical protein n=1 Tax=Actinoplanes digitatis TaxID=1868 RepID=UPI003608EFD1
MNARNSSTQKARPNATSTRIRPDIVRNRPRRWSTQMVGTTAGGMISPDSTRKLTRPFHRPRRRCSTYATMAEVTAMMVTLATVRMVLLM